MPAERTIPYGESATDARRRVEAGEFGGGKVLPSEADLSAAYGASRVTVRRALEVLRDEGIVDARQGFGWFVQSDLLRQRLGRLSTIEGQLAASGITAERQILDFAFAPAEPRVHPVLGTIHTRRVR